MAMKWDSLWSHLPKPNTAEKDRQVTQNIFKKQ